MKNLILLLSLIVIFLASCQPKHDHPRILLLEGEEQAIKEQVANNETWAKMHLAIIDESEEILKLEPQERIQIGRRLLSVSREYLRRIFFLSYAYRMTGDERFATHAEKHMLKSAGFTDWNPSHFLDVGEMTMALAIGYDWLYDEISESSKEIIKTAIVEKGIKPSFNDKYNWFLDAEHNWNQVCNAGMTYGALAIQEDYPTLADSVIERAFETITKPMKDYQPDGAYPEGTGYWGYGTSFNVLFLSAVEKALGTDRGLAKTPGFLETAAFKLHMLGPSTNTFSWGDCKPGGHMQPTMFWFTQRTNSNALLWMEKQYLETDNYAQFTNNRLLPTIMIWGKDIPMDAIPPPTENVWMGQGKNPVCLMRTSWENPHAIFLGLKAGSPSVNHGHMDIGSFVLEADGERWSSDLGAQSYESLESRGMSIFGRTQDAQRWTIFRLNNYSHSTLIVDNELQRVEGYARIDKYSDSPDFKYAVSDISGVFKGQLKAVKRGVAIKDKQYVVVRDEFETLDKMTSVRWNMMTEANVDITEKGAILTQNGKTLIMNFKGPKNIKIQTWSTEPTTDYDAENPGTIMVGFECKIPANSKQKFEVLLIPEKAKTTAEFVGKSLDEW